MQFNMDKFSPKTGRHEKTHIYNLPVCTISFLTYFYFQYQKNSPYSTEVQWHISEVLKTITQNLFVKSPSPWPSEDIWEWGW